MRSLVDGYHCFGGICFFQLQSRNFLKLLGDFMAVSNTVASKVERRPYIMTL
jgi:hypothetical protein